MSDERPPRPSRPTPGETPPRPPDVGPSSRPRFTSHSRRLRERHGGRVFRISVPLEAGPEPAETARDLLVSEMVRLNHRHGATRFQAVIEAPRGALDAGAVADLVRACLSPAPVVGLVLVAGAEAVTTDLLGKLREAVGDGDTALELPLPAASQPSGSRDVFARAATLAREASIPVTAVRIVNAASEETGALGDDASLLNRLRVRAVKIHPAGTADEDGAEAYLEAVADLVEQLDPAVQIQGLGPAPFPDRPADEPAWLTTGEDFHDRLEQTLAARGGRQGCRAGG